MVKWSRNMIVGLFLIMGLMVTHAAAGPLPHGDTQVKLIDEYEVRIGLQFRAMWNSSNIPIAGVTDATNPRSYDFFRQRMRFNLDVKPGKDKDVGGFMQLEYRGGWGGTSPTSSDPRTVGLSLNAFNRLEARGVRYGYIYYTPLEEANLEVGIIPVSDQLGDILFSSDWDFNVGGISFHGELDDTDYRLGFVRLVDGIASSDSAVIDENGDIYIADANHSMGMFEMGAHVYYLYIRDQLAEDTDLGLVGNNATEDFRVAQGWYALSGSVDPGPLSVNGFFCLNTGQFGNSDNTGWALKGEVVVPLGDPTFKVMAIHASGEREGTTTKDHFRNFRTIQGIVGTQGYWAYTHIFTANGPSDVNDLGTRVDGGDRGLTTIQGKFETPIIDKLNGEIVYGWFNAAAENAAGDKEMGSEVGGMLTYEMAEYLNLQAGGAYAFLDDTFISNNDFPDDLYEIFTRFQLQF